MKKGLGIPKNKIKFSQVDNHLLCLLFSLKYQAEKFDFVSMDIHWLCLLLYSFKLLNGKDWIGMDKQQKGYGYITKYKMGSTTYEVKTTFSGTETLNNKIVRLMLSEKIKSKEADNSEKTRYNSNIHSVLSGDEKEDFNNE